MIATRQSAPCGRAFRASVLAFVVAAGLVLLGSQAQAEEGLIHACIQKSSLQVRIVPAPTECKNSEFLVSWNAAGVAGPQGDKGDKGDKGDPGPQSVAAAAIATGPVALTTSCGTLAEPVSITVPPGSPAGLLIARAKVRVRISHVPGQATAQDLGYVVFSTASTSDCSGGIGGAAFKSFFSVPPGWPGTGSGSPLEVTVFVQSWYDIDPGGGTVVVYLNGLVNPGAGATPTTQDFMQDANVVLEFHPK